MKIGKTQQTHIIQVGLTLYLFRCKEEIKSQVLAVVIKTKAQAI